jgi:hypothetical protein
MKLGPVFWYVSMVLIGLTISAVTLTLWAQAVR